MHQGIVWDIITIIVIIIIIIIIVIIGCRNSLVGIATCYGNRIPVKARFSILTFYLKIRCAGITCKGCVPEDLAQINTRLIQD
jgi:hypothetical protein